MSKYRYNWRDQRLQGLQQTGVSANFDTAYSTVTTATNVNRAGEYPEALFDEVLVRTFVALVGVANYYVQGDDFEAVNAGELANKVGALDNGWVHAYRSLNSSARLYVPCHYRYVPWVIRYVWSQHGCVGLKATNWEEGRDRADDIVGWFSRSLDAVDCGASLDGWPQIFSGTRPLGSFPCSHRTGGATGWAWEVGSSLTTDVVTGLQQGMFNPEPIRGRIVP